LVLLLAMTLLPAISFAANKDQFICESKSAKKVNSFDVVYGGNDKSYPALG